MTTAPRRRDDTGRFAEESDGAMAFYRELGITRLAAFRWRKLATVSSSELEAFLDDVIAEGRMPITAETLRWIDAGAEPRFHAETVEPKVVTITITELNRILSELEADDDGVQTEVSA